LLVAAAERLGVPARIDKVSDPSRIAALGALRVPGVAVNGRLVYRVASAMTTELWLRRCAQT
jgi:hypothetical protein